MPNDKQRSGQKVHLRFAPTELPSCSLNSKAAGVAGLIGWSTAPEGWPPSTVLPCSGNHLLATRHADVCVSQLFPLASRAGVRSREALGTRKSVSMRSLPLLDQAVYSLPQPP